jgi:alpha-L-arabinofuranosidase
LLGDENTESLAFLMKCLDNSNDVRSVRVRFRIDEDMIDEGFGLLLDNWNTFYHKAKTIEKNIDQLGTLPVGTNQSYVVKKSYGSVLEIQIKISECLESILSYTSS